MNWLAHLYLADRTGTSMAGQLLGDQVKGRLERLANTFDAELICGIRLHRRIDSVADAHAAHQTLRRHISTAQRRYAGIIVDIGFDHALALRWPDLSPDESLRDFSARAAACIHSEWPADHIASAPSPRAFAALLAGYRKPAGILKALRHVQFRLRGRHHFDASVAADAISQNIALYDTRLTTILDDIESALIKPAQ